MRVVVQPYAHSQDGIRGEGSPNKVDFPRDEVPSHDKLQRWAEEQFECERTTSFPDAVQAFLYAYAAHGHGLPKVRLCNRLLPTVTVGADKQNSTVLCPRFIA